MQFNHASLNGSPQNLVYINPLPLSTLALLYKKVMIRALTVGIVKKLVRRVKNVDWVNTALW